MHHNLQIKGGDRVEFGFSSSLKIHSFFTHNVGDSDDSCTPSKSTHLLELLARA